MTMNHYSVLGFYEESGQSFCHHVRAVTPQAALKCVAEAFSAACFVAVIDGLLEEGQGITFPDEDLISAFTVEEKTELYHGDAELL